MGGKTVFESFAWERLKPQPVIGVDEAGRGCLAGPVFAAAVIIEPKSKDPYLSKYKDSKLLSETVREELFAHIQSQHRVGVGFANEAEIEELNILHAALLAMQRAVQQLGVENGHLLIDGRERIKSLTSFEQTTLVKGDIRAKPVAAASIIAKVSRDRFIRKMAEKYPHYGFESHKGYATAAHKEKIREFGPCSIHRRSFAGVREFWPPTRP